MVANYARRVIGRAAEMDRITVEQSSVSPRKINETLSMVKKESAGQGQTPYPHPRNASAIRYLTR